MAGWDAWPLKGVEEIDNDSTLMGYVTNINSVIPVSKAISHLNK